MELSYYQGRTLPLMDSNHLSSRDNDKGSHLVHDLINLVEPKSWNIEEVTIPWMEAEEKLRMFQEIFLLQN